MSLTVIFDCDGVLVDSEIIANRVEARLKTELGFPTTWEEQVRKFVGLGPNPETVREELRRLPPDYLENCDRLVHEAYLTELRPIAGVRDLLEASAFPRCVASSS